MFPVTIALIDEWIIRHNWSDAWSSVSIPHDNVTPATVYCVTDTGQTVVDTLPNMVARDTVQFMMDRTHEYTVTRQ